MHPAAPLNEPIRFSVAAILATLPSFDRWFFAGSVVLGIIAVSILLLMWRLNVRLRREIISRAQAERDLLEAKEAAELAANAKAEFLAHVSHDLRTPLHSILILTEVMQGGTSASEQSANLASIREAGNSLLSMVNDLLDINRIESGRIDLADDPFQLDDILDTVADLLWIPARRKGVELVHWIEPGLVDGLRGDSSRLRQILFNLGGNAVKFTESGHIILKAKRSETGWLRLEVANTGPGISAELLPNLFEPFVRGNADRNKEGSGLGLAIVRRFVEAMGGLVTVRSERGKETVFTVDLPLLDSVANERMRAKKNALTGKRILVALSTPLRTEAASQGLRGLGATIIATNEQMPGDIWIVEAEETSHAARIAAKEVKIVGVHPEAALNRRTLARAILDIPDENHPPPPELLSSKGGLHVLLVDDDALSRKVGHALLAQNGCVVHEATGGLEALDILAEQPFHLVILDGHMPDFDGIEITNRIRAFDAAHLNYKVPVIALTADLSESRKNRWMEAGACVVLGKPTSLRELKAATDAFVKFPTDLRGT